jgi:hypothetical protein
MERDLGGASPDRVSLRSPSRPHQPNPVIAIGNFSRSVTWNRQMGVWETCPRCLQGNERVRGSRLAGSVRGSGNGRGMAAGDCILVWPSQVAGLAVGDRKWQLSGKMKASRRILAALLSGEGPSHRARMRAAGQRLPCPAHWEKGRPPGPRVFRRDAKPGGHRPHLSPTCIFGGSPQCEGTCPMFLLPPSPLTRLWTPIRPLADPPYWGLRPVDSSGT